MKLHCKDLVGLRIGNWSSSMTPEGTIIWSRSPLGLILKTESNTVLMATPHYDRPNYVEVDLFPDFNQLDDEGICVLQTSFKLGGVSAEQDRKIYLEYLTQIFKILK